MAFNAGATDYGGMLDLRRMSDKQVTQALDAKGRADKRARIKKSGERSGLQKLGSAAVRGAAAYYTGGASESMGFGGAIDDVMLGTDSEGGKIQNEYGDLVKTGSAVYGSMKAKKAGDVAAKRASNVQDFKEQVGLAEKMGVLDKKQGRDMMLDAMDLRSRQQAQTQKGEDAGVWGWGGEFDDLEMSPTQKAGKQEADLRVGPQTPPPSVLSEEAKKKMAPSEAEIVAKYEGDQRMAPDVSGEELDKGEREFRQTEDVGYSKYLKGKEEDKAWDKISADMDARQGPRKGLRGEGDFSAEDAKWNELSKQMDMEDMMDQEYNKRMSPIAGVTSDEFVSDYLGGGRKGTDDKYAPDWMTGKDKFKGSPMSKSYLEKAPKEDDYRSEMDKMADESDRRKRVLAAKGEWGGYKPDWARGKDEKQLLLEDRLQKEEALKREHARTGGPYGRADYEGSIYKPFKSALKKRIEKRRQKAKEVALRRGGILAGGSAQ